MTYKKQRFHHVFDKASHYDDDGYVIQWFRSAISSNSLAVLYGLAKECAEEKILGEFFDFEIHAFDETNYHINPKKIRALIEKAGGGMVMLAGVQSNRFPRPISILQNLCATRIFKRQSAVFTFPGLFRRYSTLKEKDARAFQSEAAHNYLDKIQRDLKLFSVN